MMLCEVCVRCGILGVEALRTVLGLSCGLCSVGYAHSCPFWAVGERIAAVEVVDLLVCFRADSADWASLAVDVWTSWFFSVDLRMEDVICVGVIPGCALAQNSPTLEFGCYWDCFDVVVPTSFI